MSSSKHWLPAGLLALSSLASPSLAANLLYVASYSGAVTTLNLTLAADNATSSTLEILASSNACAPSPSWLTLDYPNSVLYCTDENLATASRRGSLNSFKTSPNGSLVALDRLDTIWGPVSAVIYGKGGRGLGLAHYLGSSISAFNISDPAALVLVSNETFTQPGPGPVPSRQEAPHPHQTVLDPTGQFILVPDLGADLVRIYHVDPDTLEWTPREPLAAASGSGPRHLTFLVTEDKKTFMYLISELTNTVTGYAVTYQADGELAFEQIYIGPTHGIGNTVPQGAGAAEILISPDSRFLVLSSRYEQSSTIPSFDPADDGALVKSDSLISFTIDHATGKLTFLQKAPAGGTGPRHFVLNKAGTLAAVALQLSSRIVIFRRDVTTGELGDVVATAKVAGELSTVIFAE